MNSTKRVIAVISSFMVFCFMFAGCAATGAAGGTGTGSTTGSAIQSIGIIVVFFAVFYFFLIRPENKKKKKVEEMRSSLSNGDEIVTIGGIKGKIVSIGNDSITFETGEDRVRIQVAKWAISSKGK